MATVSRATRRLSRANAAIVKAGGGGATATGTRQTSFGIKEGIIGAIEGFITGGPSGAVAGGVAGLTDGGRSGGLQRTFPGAFPPQGFAPTECPGRLIKVGSNCVDPLALPPGGKPAVVPMGGTQVGGGGGAVMGAFGLPAMTPRAETRIVRECGPGMVLGKDNLCYPKAILSRRSKFRKWRQAPRPPVTSGDVAAIRRAARARDRVAGLAKDVGFKVKKK